MAAALALEGDVTMGAALGLLAVLGIAARNGILLVKRYQEMERREDRGFVPTWWWRGRGSGWPRP